MSEEKNIIKEISQNFSIEKLNYFISEKNDKYSEDNEEYNYFDYNNLDKVVNIGNIKFDIDRLGVFYIEFDEDINYRTSKKTQYELGKEIIKEKYLDAGIFIFYSKTNNNFRFSYIYAEYFGSKRTFSHYKRYTFFVSSELTNKTFIEQISNCNFSSLEEIKKAFSVEKLSKEFFTKYKDNFEEFNKFAYNNFKNLLPFSKYSEEYREKAIRDFNKKLLGRIVFIYFLQKKGWVGVPKENNDWSGGSTIFLSEQFNKLYKNSTNIFYIDFLEPLFYDTLNKKRENDIFLLTDSKIPFLNGGLFELEEMEKKGILFYPNELFKNLFEYLDQYNFTIIEDSVEEKEVAIDPEMLGHIFENLLEDNKEKGVFYTPKEIVKYMCQESLINYLNANLSNELTNSDEKDLISNFIRFGIRDDNKKLIKKYAKRIEELLDDIKVLDPAIGSGAFPMGILHEIFNAKLNLDWTLDKAKAKRKIIENSIYGVDIEKGAVDIAMLRFWLSLVVDEEEPSPLPNLDYKIMVGDSLKGDNLSDKDMFHKYFLDEIQKLKHEFYETDEPKIKKHLKKNIEDKTDKLSKTLNINLEEGFNFKLEFFEVFDTKDGFDIVIGNPPYIQLQNNNGYLNKLYEKLNFKTYAKTGDIYSLFYERGINLLKDRGILSFITSNKWMRAGYGEKLRKFFLEYNPKLLIDLGPNIFENATVDTNIIFIEKAKYTNSTLGLNLVKDKDKSINIFEQIENNSCIISNLSNNAWFIGDNSEQKLKEKIEKIGKPLKIWDIKINYGIKTGLNEAFIIDTNKRNEILNNCKTKEERELTENIIKPLLRGRDIKRYSYNWAGLWVIIIPSGWTNSNRGNIAPEDFIKNKLNSLYNSLLPFKAQAEKRSDKGDYWWELRKCAYYNEFEKEKIVYSEIAQKPNFNYDINNNFISNTGYILTADKNLKYILAYLNSKFNGFSYKKWYSTNLGEKGIRWLYQHVINIPIPPITPSNQNQVEEIELLVDKILDKKKNNIDTIDLENRIDQIVYKLYDLTDDEIRIIEI